MSKKWFVGLTLVLLLALTGGSLWWSGTLAQLADPDRVRQIVADAGIAGPVVFIGIVTLLFPLLMHGLPIWLSGTIWPLPLAILYSGIASALASLIFFGLGRWLGRDWAAERIPDKLRVYEEKLEQHPYRTIVVLRILLWLNPATDLLIGASRVSTRAYLIASAAVLVPLNFLHVIIAAKGIALAARMPDLVTPGAALGLLAAVACLAGFGMWIVARRRRARHAAE